MARKYAFLVGNGLSAAFDPRLTSAAISERVFSRLSEEEQAYLRRLAELLRPETPAPALDVARGDFEAVAGPIDRMADALVALDGLLRGLRETGPLTELAVASEALRNLYRRIVGIVLAEIDACCQVEGEVSEERRDAWNRLNTFAAAIAAKAASANRSTQRTTTPCFRPPCSRSAVKSLTAFLAARLTRRSGAGATSQLSTTCMAPSLGQRIWPASS